jgi:hypothetical protein
MKIEDRFGGKGFESEQFQGLEIHGLPQVKGWPKTCQLLARRASENDQYTVVSVLSDHNILWFMP